MGKNRNINLAQAGEQRLARSGGLHLRTNTFAAFTATPREQWSCFSVQKMHYQPFFPKKQKIRWKSGSMPIIQG